jgi:hypothetical protein
MLPFNCVLPDVNDRTQAAVDRFSATWNIASDALQRMSTVAYQADKSAMYGEAHAHAAWVLDQARKTLDAFTYDLVQLAEYMEKPRS